MLRLEINPPARRGIAAEYVADMRPVDHDPFAAVSGPGIGSGTVPAPNPFPVPADMPAYYKATTPPPGARSPAPGMMGTAPVDYDPFAGYDPAAQPQAVRPSLDARWKIWEQGYGTGSLEPGPDPTAIPAPGTPVARESEYWGMDDPGFMGLGGSYSPRVYGGTPSDVPAYGGDLSFTPPPGYAPATEGLDTDLGPSFAYPGGTPTERRPDWWYRPDPQEVGSLRHLVENTPVGTGREPNLSQELRNQPQGSTKYDPMAGDAMGGQPSNRALLTASLIPLTSEENARKRIAIYADDLGIDPSRFFVDPKGNIRYVDYAGQTFMVAPTLGGGTWRAPLDLANRAFTQLASEAGQVGVETMGMVGGYVGGLGPIAKGLGGMAGAGIAAGGSEIARQISGNLAAKKAGYARPPGAGTPRMGHDALDIDWLNFGGQVVQNMGFEAFARSIPVLLNGIVPAGWFGTNPYYLNRQETQDLAYLLAYDAERGGHILRRAQAMHELGLPLTPADLLQITDGLGIPAGFADVHGRLLQTFQSLETTLANRMGKRGAGAQTWMQNFYRERQQALFPAAVNRYLDMLAPAGSTSIKEGFVNFQRAANDIVRNLETARLEAAGKAGWDDLFAMPNMKANARPARDLVDQELAGATGTLEQELQKVRKGLVESNLYTTRQPGGGEGTRVVETPQTDYQVLHRTRLELRKTIDRLDRPGSSAADKDMVEKLERVEDVLAQQLRQNPLYQAGDDAFRAAGAELRDARHGLITLVQENPLYQEKLGGALAQAGPTRISAAREMFRRFGKMDAWNAHTRAYLEHSLNLAADRRTGEIGNEFFSEVAGTPTLRAGLRELAPDTRTGNLLDELVSAGHAMDTRPAGTRQVGPQVRVNTNRLTVSNNRNDNIYDVVASPFGYGLRRFATGAGIRDAWRERRSLDAATNMTLDPGAVYRNMQQTSIPLAGPSGEILERTLYGIQMAGLPEVTNWLPRDPRTNPDWLLKLTLPYLHGPPSFPPTAPDLAQPPSVFDRFLGPAP